MEGGEEVYKISELAFSYVDENIETMDDWLISMSDEELSLYHSICDKDEKERSAKEDYEICRYALILYCRELLIDEVAITEVLLSKIIGLFCYNVKIEALRRKGYVTTDGILLLYKETKINITEKGKEKFKEEN